MKLDVEFDKKREIVVGTVAGYASVSGISPWSLARSAPLKKDFDPDLTGDDDDKKGALERVSENVKNAWRRCRKSSMPRIPTLR